MCISQCIRVLVYWCSLVWYSNVIQMRKAHKDAFLQKHGIKLGFMSPFIRAACFALQDQPVVNAGELS